MNEIIPSPAPPVSQGDTVHADASRPPSVCLEFFTAQISNDHTLKAYTNAACRISLLRASPAIRMDRCPHDRP